MHKQKMPIILAQDPSLLKNLETPWLFEGLCPILKSLVSKVDNPRPFADAAKTLMRQIDCNPLGISMSGECLRIMAQRP